MQELTPLWQAVLDNLRPHHTNGVVELWFGDARLAAFDETKAVVVLKNEFKRGLIGTPR